QACADDPTSGPCKMLLTAVAECSRPFETLDRCPDGADGLKRLRAIVVSTANINLIPDGVTYTCTFTIAANAHGSAVLQNAPPIEGQRYLGAGGPDGQKLVVDGRDGVIVIAPAPPTSTATPSRPRPISSPTSTSTAARSSSSSGGDDAQGSTLSSGGGSGGCNVSADQASDIAPLLLAVVAVLQIRRRAH
ncbi:MAG TPA: hypothetical protein VL403_03820, partial [Candidatus Kryptonia bacterium]|nr:hypothetical protein [Candidatus Kryptonia bacterium]